MLNLEEQKKLCDSILEIARENDSESVTTRSDPEVICRIFCLESMNNYSAFTYLSLQDITKEHCGIKFQLSKISPEDGERTVFDVTFPDQASLNAFHGCCTSGDFNRIAISHRVLRVEFPRDDLANINYINSDNDRFLKTPQLKRTGI